MYEWVLMWYRRPGITLHRNPVERWTQLVGKVPPKDATGREVRRVRQKATSWPTLFLLMVLWPRRPLGWRDSGGQASGLLSYQTLVFLDSVRGDDRKDLIVSFNQCNFFFLYMITRINFNVILTIFNGCSYGFLKVCRYVNWWNYNLT